MISRRTTKVLADLFSKHFTRQVGRAYARYLVNQTELYDFLYERDYEPYVCNLFKETAEGHHLADVIKKFHTTESLVTETKWTDEARVDWCQNLLQELASDLLSSNRLREEETGALRKSLELDGYVFTDGKLRKSEGETKDVEQERGELLNLYVKLGLPNEAIVSDCLKMSEEHFSNGAFRDCITNARHFLEQVLHDVAAAWSERPGEPALVIPQGQPPAGPSRNYLQDRGVISDDERKSFKELHGLLSVTGGHPFLPEEEQARVFRRLALSMALFTLLVYQAKR